MDELAKQSSQHYQTYFTQYADQLAGEGAPHILYIGCVDSRLAPELMFNLSPGEMFVLRVPGGIIPPQGMGDVCVAGTLELVLSSTPSLRDVVVCAHTDCLYLKKVVEGVDSYELSNLTRWLAMADYAHAQASALHDKTTNPQAFQQGLLEAVVQRNLQCLREIRMVKDKEVTGELTLHGWYHDLSIGQIFAYDEDSKQFEVFGKASAAASTTSPTDAKAATPSPVPAQTSASTKVMPLQPGTRRKPSKRPLVGTQPTPRPTPIQVKQAAASAPPPVEQPSVAPDPVVVPSVAPTPVDVPQARPVQRVYPTEVSTATQTEAETVAQSPAASSTLEARMKTQLRRLMKDIKRPAERARLRRLLNQMHSDDGWEAVQEVVNEINSPQLRHSLREVSIELKNPESRRRLRQIITQNGVAKRTDIEQVQKEFLALLESLKLKQ